MEGEVGGEVGCCCQVPAVSKSVTYESKYSGKNSGDSAPVS